MEKPLDRASFQAEPGLPANPSPASRHRVRDAVFACILCVMLCGPAALTVTSRVSDVQLPSWLTAVDGAYLAGVSNKVKMGGTVSLEGFQSGELQAKLEDGVGKRIPAKGAALMATAAWQRGAIEASNALFSWPCYPTFYDSDIVAVPAAERLAEMPAPMTEKSLLWLGNTSEALSAFAKRHADQRTFMYLAPDSQNVEGAVASGLMSNPFTYGQAADAMLARADGYAWIDGQVSYDDFLAGWYKTDHHWNVLGSYQAYERIATALGKEDDLLRPTGSVRVDGPPFFGSFARRGLDEAYSDDIPELVFDDLPTYTVLIKGKEVDPSELVETDFSNITWVDNKYSNRYGEFFHVDYGLIEIHNDVCESDEELVIVADSFSNCMERFLAAHYRTTYVLDARHTKQTLDDFLAQHENVADIVFLMREPNVVDKDVIDFLAPSDPAQA
ncbi:hypothetical protein GMI69_02630 [Eggerthellaceae bacterium zg-887]|uniref:DHHW family protein n=1 Tax=Xiamenia xianingshaonis TaxID=2682776 RepID=UPI00140E7581|nr:DHHW family protein [Xiamenia xianingshaonis]NHM15569.1 hypothetical protein [Xiamenia xianingshaonis]